MTYMADPTECGSDVQGAGAGVGSGSDWLTFEQLLPPAPTLRLHRLRVHQGVSKFSRRQLP